MSPTLLHVVYAGSGDALVFEDDDKLFVIDGGPFGAPNWHGRVPQWKRYHQCLLDIAESMGRPTTDLEPDGMVVSHAHSDHFGGISRMFTELLAKKPATGPNGAHTLVFDGPLVTQVLPPPGAAKPRSLSALLNAYGFTPRGKWRQKEPLKEAFTFSQDPPFYRYDRGTRALPARVWTVDTALDNLASVLMFHKATNTLFTGDSAGYLIDAFIRLKLRGKTLPIFKVPHHGSLRNSQRGQPLGTVPDYAWQQYGLLCIGSEVDDWDAIQLPADLRDAGAIEAAKRTLEQACGRVRPPIEPDDLVTELKFAFHLTVSAIAAGTPKPFVETRFRPSLINQLWQDVYDVLSPAQAGTRAAPGSKKRGRNDGVVRAWLQKLTATELSDVFYSLLATKELAAFFKEFEARNHVISADRTHEHPAAETLAGIAAAARSKGSPVRVLVTNGSAVQFSRLAQLQPDWTEGMELRYLASGNRMVLDPTAPDAIGTLDPQQTTANLMPTVTLADVQAQLRRDNGAAIAARRARSQPVKLEAEDQNHFLNLDAAGGISVTVVDQELLVDQAWMLGLMDVSTVPFPGTFDDVRLTVADPALEGASRLITLVEPGDGKTYLRVESFAEGRRYVSTDPNEILTPDPAKAAPFCFVLLDEEGAARAAATEEQTVPLGEFLSSIGVPTGMPISCEKALPQLVGPETAAAIEDQVLSRLVQRALAWDADLGASKVTYSLDAYGPLVHAAEIETVLGAERDFTVDDQQETIAAASLTLGTTEAGAVTATGEVDSVAGTTVSDSAVDPEPRRSRPLDQYLFALGVPAAEWPLLTTGTLLGTMVGSSAEAARLLLAAPSKIVSAGIGEWRLDHEASSVESQRTATGDYTEVVAAHLALQAPAAIVETVDGMAISFSEIALEIGYARLPTATVDLVAVATVAATPLRSRIGLRDGDCVLRLELPEGSDLQKLIDLLPAGAAGLAGLEVPLTDKPLGALTLSAPTIEVHQPSIGAVPYELAAAGGKIDLPDWQQALPTGWPTPGQGEGTVEVEVLDPANAKHRLLALAVSFLTPVAGAEAETVLEANPVSASSWSYAVSLSLDPVAQPRTAAAVLEAVGLSGPARSLEAELPSLAPVLGRLVVERLTFTPAPSGGGEEDACVEMTLISMTDWDLLPGIVPPRLARVELSQEGGHWFGRIEGEATVGGAGAVAISGELGTAERGGAISFENGSAGFTVSALADLCKLGDLGEVPIVGGLTEKPVAKVELFTTPDFPAALSAADFNFALDPTQVGVLDLTWASVEVLRTLLDEGKPEPSTGFWLEGRWGSDIVASLLYDDAEQPETLAGSLRLTAPVTLGTVLSRLLEAEADSTLLPAVDELPMDSGRLLQRSDDEFELLSCAIAVEETATLPVAAASAGELTARWVGAHDEEGQEEEVPEVYMLDGRLAREECKYEAALEVRFRGDEEAKTVAGTIKAAPPLEEEDEEEAEAKRLTVATLLELLDLERPEMLTPDGAPEFFELEPTSVEAVFSVEPFQLEALTILVVEEDEPFPLLPQPQPIDLEKLSLRVEYERDPEEGEADIRGVILGDLPLHPKAVTLAYTEPEGEQAAFRAEVELEEKDAPDYRRLIGTEPYEPGYGLPEGLEIPIAIPMTILTVTARPDEYVDLRGHDERTTWEAQVERLKLNVGALGGSVKVTPGATAEAPHEFALSLFGRLGYHGFVGADAVFSWGPNSRSLLSASATDEVGEIEVPAIAEDLGLRWRGQVPTETPDFAFATAWTYADLTDPTAPSFGLYGDGALGPVKGTAALLSRIAPTGLHADFLFGAEAEGAFPLQPLWQQLGEIVDGYLDLASGNLAVLGSEESGAEVEEDLAGLLEIAADQSPEYTPPFTDLPPLAEALPEGTRLRAGLSVLASVDADAEGSLNRALTEIAKPEPLPLLLAWGPVDPQEPERSRFAVDLAGLVAFDGAVSVDAVAEYAPSEAEALLAPQATGHVEVDASSYDFPGGLTIEAEAATFASDDGKGPTIMAPFGAVGADLRNCALSATYRYPPGKAIERELRIVGFVDLEVEEKRQDEEENNESGVTRGVTCEAAIEFAAGTAAVVVFALPGSMQATDFYENAMTGGTWPVGYRSFGLTQPRFHAAREAVTIEGTEYPAGYHALGTTRFLRHQFEIDVAIEKEGLRVGGASATAIDFTYLLLAEPDVGLFTGKSSSQPPPEPPSFRVGGAAEIFQGDFGRLDFGFDPALKGWTGLATCDEELVGVPVPEVLFSYTAEGGLRLVDWPLRPTLDDEELDWEEELEEASEGSECGKLEDLGLDEGENEDKTTETSFDLSMEQVGELEGDTLSVVLSGQYTVTVKSSEGERSTTMAFPDTSGTIAPASSFQLGQLEDWVKETIQSNHEELGKSLLEERDVEGEPGLESFLEEFGFEEAEAELIERLLCREDGPKKVRTRAEHIVEETEEKATKKLKEAEDELEEVETSTTISVLFAFLITFFAWIAIVFQWIVFLGGPGFFGGLIGRIWPWLPPGRREEWEELVTKSQQAEAEGERVRGWVATKVLAMRGFPDVAFADRTTVEVSWDADNLPAYEGMDYEEFLGFAFEVEVATDAEFKSILGTVTVPFPLDTATVTDPVFAQLNYAYARLRALYEGVAGSWIGGKAFHKVALPAPEPVSQVLDPEAGEIVVSATALAYAVSYTFELLDTLSGTVVATRNVTARQPSPATIPAVFSCDDLPSPGAAPLLLLGRARAIGDEIAHEGSAYASAPQSEAVATLGPPQLNAPTLVPEGIQVTWSAVPGAEGYGVRVLDSQDQPLSPQPDSTPAGLGCVLSGDGLLEGAELKVEVRAFAANAIGCWSAAAPFTVMALSPPSGLEALYSWPENVLELQWEEVTGALSYQLAMVDEAGQPLAPVVKFNGLEARVEGSGIGPDRGYRLRVRGVAPGRSAIWSSWLALTTRALPPPAEPSLRYRRRAIWADCWPVPEARKYEVELLPPGGNDVSATVPAPPAVFGAAEGIEPRLGETYEANLRAIVGANATDLAVAEAKVPPLLTVAMANWSEEVACQETARECLALERKVGPAQLWDTLVASGYSSREAWEAVLAVLPKTTPAELEAIDRALDERLRMIEWLKEESVPGPVIIALCHALYGPVPVQLLVLLEEVGFKESAQLASAFAATFPLTLAEAELLVAAVFSQPWRFGAVAAAERQDAADAAALLRRATVRAPLPLAASLAALNAADYTEADLKQAFPASAQEWGVAWTATRGDPTGVALAAALKATGVGRAPATGYVAACWPQLTEAQVKEAIAKAYGPSARREEQDR